MKMKRFVPYLGIVAGLSFFVFVAAFINEPLNRQPAKIPTASSTLSVVPSYTVPTITLPSLEQIASSTEGTPAPQEKVVPPVKKMIPPASVPAAAPASAPVSVPTNPLPPVKTQAELNAELDAVASTVRSTLVNILCYAPAGSNIRSISGSGIFVDSKGIILTNAHIAQYFLLADRGVGCTIRVGSPAVDTYKASLIYISPSWLKANPSVLTKEAPSGTGEYDFAFLAVSGSTSGSTLPSSFPSIPLAVTPSTAG
ncbi:MAG: hypothetical protein AAB737_04005, partial [Patescibacteria group bacterium]